MLKAKSSGQLKILPPLEGAPQEVLLGGPTPQPGLCEEQTWPDRAMPQQISSLLGLVPPAGSDNLGALSWDPGSLWALGSAAVRTAVPCTSGAVCPEELLGPAERQVAFLWLPRLLAG